MNNDLNKEINSKVFFIAPSLCSGGSEKMISMIANYISETSNEVYLLVINNSNQHYKISERIKIVDLKKKSVKSSWSAIIRLIYKHKPKVVFSTLTTANVLTSAISFLFPSIRFIIRESSILSINNKQMGKPKLVNFLIKWLYPKLDIIVAQSNAMKDDMIKNYGIPKSKIVQIYNPIRPQNITPNRVLGNIPTFISVGNLRPEKGYDRILKALSIYEGEFTYQIIGDGPLMDELSKVIDNLGLEKRVKLLGRQSNPFDFLQNADVYLMGSYFEGFPNSVLEAGVCGLPTVAFNAPGGTKEIINNRSIGFLIPNGEIKGFADGVKRAVSKQWDRKRIRNKTLQMFDYDTAMKKYKNVIDGKK